MLDITTQYEALRRRDARLDGVVFMAVGAGHLSGKNSVLVMLKAHHLKAERVKY